MFEDRKENYKSLNLLKSKLDINMDNVVISKFDSLNEISYILKGYIIITNKKDSTSINFNISSIAKIKEDLSTTTKLMDYFYLIIANECSDYLFVKYSGNKIFTDGEQLFLNAEKFYKFIMKALTE